MKVTDIILDMLPVSTCCRSCDQICLEGSRPGTTSSRRDLLPRGSQREQPARDLREDAKERVYSTGIADLALMSLSELTDAIAVTCRLH